MEGGAIMTQTPSADIVERLRAKDWAEISSGGFCREELVPVNPDGPEAATEIEALRAREAELTGFDLIPEGEHAKALTRIDALRRQLDEAVKLLTNAKRILAFQHHTMTDSRVDEKRYALAMIDQFFASIRGEAPTPLPDDVRRLVIAVRDVAYTDAPEPEALHELDKAVEAFAERVDWNDQPPIRGEG